MSSSNPKPNESARERTAQGYLRELGYKFTTHVKTLPSTPDIVLTEERVIIQIHGCFFHQHKGCRLGRMPENNQEYWKKKFYNKAGRDRHSVRNFLSLGYRVLTIWECALDYQHAPELKQAMVTFLEGRGAQREIGKADLRVLAAQASGGPAE